MRIAIISDIHSNLAALERVLEVAENMSVETVHCLGDIVGYGAHPNECVALVRSHCSIVIRGNHDSGAIGELSLNHFNPYGKSAIRWTHKHLSKENAGFLRHLPLVATMDTMTLAHASVPEPDGWRYVVTWDEARRCFTGFTSAACFIGHTHIPVVVSEDGQVNSYKPGKRHIINVGSVGQPRDGNPRASFALYDTDNGGLEILRVPYDVERSAKAIFAARLPDYLAQRLFVGM